MNEPNAQQVDAAVRAVLAQLGGRAQGAGRAQWAEGREGGAATQPFAGRLFACSHAEALPVGTSEVRVAPGTVVTPLALDHLRKQGITLRIGPGGSSEGSLSRARATGEWGFAIADGSGIAQALGRGLVAGTEPWLDLGTDIFYVSNWAAEAEDRGAALMTAEASIAVWHANQVPGVRAAAVADADSVARAARHLGANLLVIEPAGKSLAWLKQMLFTFRRAGAPMPPAGLSSRSDDYAHRRGDRPGDTFPRPAQPAQWAVCACAAHDVRSTHGRVAHAG